MPTTYSTWEAKAKFSEIVRKVRQGQSVYVSYRGERVAEIRPLDSSAMTLEERLRSLEKNGTIAGAMRAPGALRPLAKKKGALRRFLESRE
ncbi:MAG TPA: type II toxin-antitoxin system prevent-host-death family antitoxin [Thermoanaerobaculia bacterium]|nr:type II toxin-antitoxin system prevent-host-death family antitoxin [Thermoanaerobaculia bacterium]